MLIDENNLDTKEIDIYVCNILLIVRIIDSQLKVDNIIDLRLSITIRIII